MRERAKGSKRARPAQAAQDEQPLHDLIVEAMFAFEERHGVDVPMPAQLARKIARDLVWVYRFEVRA